MAGGIPHPHGQYPLSSTYILHCVNAAYKSQDLLQQPWVEHASTGMPDKRTAGPATQDMCAIMIYEIVFTQYVCNNYLFHMCAATQQ